MVFGRGEGDLSSVSRGMECLEFGAFVFMAGGVEFGAFVFLMIEKPARRQETHEPPWSHIYTNGTLWNQILSHTVFTWSTVKYKW